MRKSVTGVPGGCPAIEPLLSSYAAGALDEVSETLVQDHLAACASCRAAQVERDPAVLFLELRRVPLPDGFLDTFAADVRKRVESAARARRPALFGRDVFRVPRLAYVAAPVMTLLLLGTLFLVRPGGPAFRGARRPPEGAVTSPFERTGTGVPGPLQTRVAPAAALVTGGPAGPPLLEEVGSPSARVYRFTDTTSGGDETPIYFVVDESIDIR